jgi:hypothetical protein
MIGLPFSTPLLLVGAFMVYLVVLILCSVFYKAISRRDRTVAS